MANRKIIGTTWVAKYEKLKYRGRFVDVPAVITVESRRRKGGYYVHDGGLRQFGVRTFASRHMILKHFVQRVNQPNEAVSA